MVCKSFASRDSQLFFFTNFNSERWIIVFFFFSGKILEANELMGGILGRGS